MLLKCCMQYASKFGKLSSGHRTGKGHFSFQSQRRAMPKNVQGTIQLCSFHMLARLCSESFKLGFNSTWTKNFQMYKWILKWQRNQRSNCQHLLDHRKRREFQKTTFAPLTTLKPLTVWITTNWKILKEMGIPDHLICFLRNLYAGQEAIVRTRRGTMDWFKTGDGVQQSCVLSPSLLYLYLEHIMWNARLDEAQAGIKVARRNITNLRYADDTTLIAENEEELKSLLMKAKEESGKSWFKTQHSKN